MKYWFLFLLLLLGCVLGNTLSFDLNGKPIDGRVYLNGTHLGNTQEGKIRVDNLEKGVLTFEGEYQGREFSFDFKVDEIRPISEFSVPEEYFSQYELAFGIKETNAPINGEVYLNDEYLGETSNGSLTLNVEELYPGLLTLKGAYEGEDFEFFFSLPRDYLSRNGLLFQVESSRLTDLLFDAGALNAKNSELLILEKINEVRRTEGGGELLVWNEDLGDIARTYAKQLETSGFHHADPSGKTVGDRLQDAKIFYTIAGENLYYSGNLPAKTSEEDLAEMALEGWLKSPGHRSLVVDRDNLYTDAGVGVHCSEKDCYVVLNLAGTRKELELTLQKNSCWYFKLYDEAYPFDYDTQMKFSIQASSDIEVYLVNDREALDNCISQSSIDSKKMYSGDDIEDTQLIKKGMGLLFETNKEADIELEIVYG